MVEVLSVLPFAGYFNPSCGFGERIGQSSVLEACQSIAAVSCHMAPSGSQPGRAGAQHASTAPERRWVVLGPERGRVSLPSQPCFDTGYSKRCSALKNTSTTSLRLPKSWRASAEHSPARGKKCNLLF